MAGNLGCQGVFKAAQRSKPGGTVNDCAGVALVATLSGLRNHLRWNAVRRQGKGLLISTAVTPAKAGVQRIPARYNFFYREGLLDSGLRRKDGTEARSI